MFDHVIGLNQFMLGYFERLNQDIPDEIFATRPAAGNSPLWILGHLALCVDFCQMQMGDELAHPRWMPFFGPGSSGEVDKPERFQRSEFETMIRDGYPAVCGRMATTEPSYFEQPHEVEMFRNSKLQTRGDILAHLLTTHFAFHLAQLSQCRKASGLERMF